MQLYKHQQDVLDANHPKWLLAMDMGTGKSLTAIELVKKNKCTSLLLICPKALKEKWDRDLTEHFKSTIRWKIMSKEEFSKLHDRVEFFQSVVVDECHYFAGHTSAMSKNLNKYLKRCKPPFIWLLSATPYMSTPWNIYTLAKLLGKEWSYLNFKEKFFTTRYIGQRPVPVVREGIESEIARLVNLIGVTCRLDECVDVPEQVYEDEFIGLSKEQEKMIKEISREDTNPIVRFTRKHQVENGTLKGDEYVEDKIVPSEKTNRIIDVVDITKKVAVVCRYTLQIKCLETILKERFPKKKIFSITGEVKNRDEVVREIENTDDCVVLINASCSEGYELPSIGTIIFASLSFSYVHYKQITGRFLRINKLKKNLYIHLITKTEGEKTVDEAVFEAIKNKQDFQIEIFANQHRNVVE